MGDVSSRHGGLLRPVSTVSPFSLLNPSSVHPIFALPVLPATLHTYHCDTRGKRVEILQAFRCAAPVESWGV